MTPPKDLGCYHLIKTRRALDGIKAQAPETLIDVAAACLMSNQIAPA